MIICRGCGIANDDKSTFCRGCGKELIPKIEWWKEYNMVPVSITRMKNSKWARFFCFLLFIPSLSSIYFLLRNKTHANRMRRKRKELLDTDYIEAYQKRSLHYVFVARGSANDHRFGLFDVQKIRMQLPFEYEELSWSTKGKLLSAKKDGKYFSLDLNGNIFS